MPSQPSPGRIDIIWRPPCGITAVKCGPITGIWSIPRLLHSIAERGQHPAIIVSGAEGFSVRTSAALVQDVAAFADGLRRKGIGRGETIVLWAPNSPEWIVVALGIMAAGGVLVPIDDLWDEAQLEAVLRCSDVRSIFISARHLAVARNTLRAKGVAVARWMRLLRRC